MHSAHKIFDYRQKSEGGFVLIAALMAVMILMAVGFFSLTVTSQDILISSRLVGERKALSAAEGGLFGEELFPVTVKKGKKEESIDRDELQKQAALMAPPADGAAMCLLTSPQKAKEMGLPILAEILSVGIAAVDPRYAAMAVVEAGMKAVDRAGLTLREVDLIELNEMSAAECLAILREWESRGIDREALADRANPSGGALAAGNPWGAAGAVLLTRAVHALRRRSGRIGMVAVTAEGGQGMAMVLRNSG